MTDHKRADDDDGMLAVFRRTFIEEGLLCLAESEAALIRLDAPEEREHALAEIFRAYHSVKGSAASVGYQDIASFAHLAEDCLSALRTNPQLVSCDMVSLLLEVNDALRQRMEGASERETQDPSWDVEGLRLRLRELLSSLGADAPGASSSCKPAATGGRPSSDRKAGEPRMAFFDDEEVPAAPPKTPAPEGQDKKKPAAAASSLVFKIEAAKVDAVMDMVGELVVIKSQLFETLSRQADMDVHARTVVGLLDKSVRELHEKTLAMRMMSLKNSFLKIQRTARDLSQKLGKPIDFTMSGEETELDRALIEQISDPLMHLVRNAIDHGLEAKDKRLDSGKHETGKIGLKAYRRGDNVLLEVHDDGGGIKREQILSKAVGKGLLDTETSQNLSDAQVYDFMFQAGFSTAALVTDVSGRGVGLDVVKSNVTAMKGRIEVESKPGKGSTFRMIIPLTTAITDGIVIELRGRKYIIPVESVRSFFEAKNVNVLPTQNGRSVVGIGGRHYHLLDVPKLSPTKPPEQVIYILLDVGEVTMALAVDAIYGKTQVVLKGLRGGVDAAGYFAGAAVMGNGQVALVLDIIALGASAEQAPSAKDLAA